VCVVASFCDPETYPTPESMRRWSAQGVIPVVVIHPKKSIDEKGLLKLQSLLELPEVVGLGEIGLDRKAPAVKWAEQMLKLETVLNLLKKEHIQYSYFNNVESPLGYVAFFLNLSFDVLSLIRRLHNL
jgi:Tat protein secretion system quality control protein TatD with DNase activity